MRVPFRFASPRAMANGGWGSLNLYCKIVKPNPASERMAGRRLHSLLFSDLGKRHTHKLGGNPHSLCVELIDQRAGGWDNASAPGGYDHG